MSPPSSKASVVTLPHDLADRILVRLNTAASAFKAAKVERDEFRSLLSHPGTGGGICLPRENAERILTRLKLTASRFNAAAVERDELRTLLNNRLPTECDKGILCQDLNCSADSPVLTPEELAAQLSDLRLRHNRLQRDMQTIASLQVPRGVTISDFASAAIAGAQSNNVGA
ncbi:hypothetical protein H8F21_14280 [Pseudomonas sp. P66]|uniref:Uncharacterized protein n=1 Tax=Pseudomonas arcuscaelestis TaxID=2710591 RepID=A0ABS2BYL9_9PSED|nr:hypothetical protein [Pseudomonas arcuscaelestis]MBM5458731.1 hypothetical protein [Pseudomonas arcuscaelestis]